MKTLGQLGVKLPKILLPKILDIKTWATIACDQYTQDKDYWKQVYSIVGSKPSTVKITFPEVYLEEPGRQERIQNIKKEMKTYINQGVFASPEEEFVYLERTTRYGRVRHGLVVIETPHIMLLVNDPNRKLVEGLGHRVKKNKPIYQGDLMMNSGSVKGWSVSNEYDIEYFRVSLQRLAEDNTQMDGSIFLFAVGDGNHSLATAKATWEEYKKNHPGIRNCNMKYALVEIVNIYDTGLTFEPIHRVLFDINPKALIDFIGGNLGGNIEYLNTFEELKNRVDNSKSDFGFIFEENKKPNFVFMKTNIKELPISQLQPAIDQFLISCNKKGSIDFIHGADELLRLGSQRGITAIYLPPIDKDSFFGTISGKGPLPRKSFSMGEADEKRFYLECRQIV